MTMRLRALLLLPAILLACDGGDPVPSGFVAGINPSRVWYATGQTVRVVGVISDQFGMPFTDASVEWTVEPAGAASIAPSADPRDAEVTFNTEGSTTFTGCVLDDEGLVLAYLCDTLTVRVDDGMPSIELTRPEPGDEIEGPGGIVVEGSVSDSSMVRIYVNGEPVDVGDMGMFSTTVDARFGVNHLAVAGSDGLTDPSAVEMDVLYAEAFTPAVGEDGTPELRIDDGLRLWLGQDFFDDGEPLDLEVEPLVTRDLADILELVIASVELGDVIPDPVVDSAPTFLLRVTDARLGGATVELGLTDEGAELFIRIADLEIDTAGALMVDTTSLPLTGTIRGSAVAYARLVINKDSEEDELTVELEGLTVGLEELEGDFIEEETTAVFRLVEGLLRTTVEDLLVDAVSETLTDSVPTVLRDALGAVDTALQDQSIDLDSDPFPPVSIQIDGRIANLSITTQTEMEAVLRTTVGTSSMATHPESLGVARLDLLRGPRFYRDGALKLGVRLAMMNALMHALWNSGLLDIDLSPILPDGISGLVSEGRLLGRLPPVLRPPTPIEDADLILTLGQLELDIVFMGEPVRYAVSIEAGVTVDLTDNTLTIDLAEEPVLRVWTIVPPEDDRLLNEALVSDILLGLWPDLRESIAGGLALELPLPSLGDLGGLAPDLAGLELTIGMTERARSRGTGGTLVLDAALTGQLTE
ncbi:MAG: hypothetical protein AB8I08_10185 [Sandaracinaceae bacterium]